MLCYLLHSIQWTFDEWSQKAQNCFQGLSFDGHGLLRKEPGGQRHLQSSPTVPHSQPHIQSCSSVVEDRKAKFPNTPNSQSMPTVTQKSTSPHSGKNSPVVFTFYQHFWRGTTCQKSRTKAKQCKFPNFPYELHWIGSCLWTDCFLVLNLFLEFSFCLFLYHLWQNGKDCPVTSVKTLINPEDYTSSTKSLIFFYLISLYTSQRKQWLASALLWNMRGP